MTQCGLTNLATCLPEKALEYLLSVLNSALAPILNIIQTLLTEPVNINIFQPLWAVMVYTISLFYGLFMLFAGFNLMISGHNVARRERAKGWFRNVIFMILFVQSSFLLYDLLIELGGLLTAGVMNIIDPQFFLLTVDNIGSVGLQLTLLFPYVGILIITILLLALRYLFIAVGVALFPFALFFYFIPPLRSYGKLILNILLVTIFITFFDGVLLFGASALLSVPIMASFKIILMTVAFMSINLLMIVLLVFAIFKAAMSVLNSDVGRSVKAAAKLLI